MTPQIEDRLLKAYGMQQAGQLQAALKAYEGILADDPANMHALNLAGVVLLQLEKHKDALRFLRAAAEIEADDAQTQSNLGLALRGAGELGEAALAFERALILAPANLTALKNLGAVHLELGDLRKARNCLVKGSQLAPGDAEFLINLARVELESGNTVQALECARRAREIAPALPASSWIIGNAHMRQCRYDAAIAEFGNALATSPDFTDAMIDQATALKEKGETEAARKVLQEACARFPDSARAHYALGLLEEQSNNPDAAQTLYRSAIAANPNYGAAWFQLSQLDGQVLVAQDRARLEAITEGTSVPGNDGHMHFALGRIAEAANDHAGGIQHYTDGHRLIARGASYDAARVEQRVSKTVEVWRPFSSDERHDADGPTPIFVVGMPRSGTTLAEQILSAHQDVGAGGESSLLEDAVQRISWLSGTSFRGTATAFLQT